MKPSANICSSVLLVIATILSQINPLGLPGTADGVAWACSLGDLIDAALAVASPDPTETAPERRRKFRIIKGGLG
jgi:hypothetical protein